MGGIGHLRGVDEQPVPIDGIILGGTHGRKQYPARVRLAVNFVHRLGVPIFVSAIDVPALGDFQGVRGTEADASVAVYAEGAVLRHPPRFRVEGVHAVGALPLADPTGYAPPFVADHLIFRINICTHCHSVYSPPPSDCRALFQTIDDGRAAAGAKILSSSGCMARMAHSSLAM